MKNDRIRVLVIDDSAFARKVVREVLSSDPEIEVVGIARDGLEGLEKISELRPDVVTLDLLMPDLDGLGVLRALPVEGRPKVIIVSVSGSETDIALEALELGAVDLVTKPTPLPTDRLYELSHELIVKVKTAAIARIRTPATQLQKTIQGSTTMRPTAPVRLVVVGTSTGGPQALTSLLTSLPADLSVPLAIALHIPEGYTEPMAARISQISKIKLIEAVDGKELIPGQALLAPGGMHLAIEARNEKLYAKVSKEPLDTPHHPSVDVLFSSAADQVGAGCLGIILTGMGNDGLVGSAKIRKKGGTIFTESESSCIVWGMPRSVYEAGLSNLEATLEEIPGILASFVKNQYLK